MTVQHEKWARRSKGLPSLGILTSPVLMGLAVAQPAPAQTRQVSACAGVSLSPSVVTTIIAPVVTGIAGPTETRVNAIQNAPILGLLLPPLNLNSAGLLTQAAAGTPITLRALATDGTTVMPTDPCRSTADAISLNAPAGVAIGGNQITGLGANGPAAFAGDIDAIALGNNARAEAGATSSVALGANARVTAANSIALGAGAVAARGALASYTATGLAGTQTSAGEVSVGAPGATRQLTNVAAGTAASDAATVGQVDGVLAKVTTLDAVAIRYDNMAHDRVTLAGATGTTLGNVAAGAVTATSTDAVNGAQLFASNSQIAANAAAIVGLSNGAQGPVRYSSSTAPTVANGGTVSDDVTVVGSGGGTVGLHNLRDGVVAAGSSDAVTGSQLHATNQTIAVNMAALDALDTRVTYTEARITGLQGTVDATNASVGTLSTQVSANSGAIAALQVGVASQPLRYADAATPTVANGGAVTDDATLAGAGGATVGLHNVRAGAAVAGSTDAVNGDQLATTNARVAANTTAIATLGTIVAGSTVTPVQYSDPATPTMANGGTRTNSVTLVGADPAVAVAVHNVAAGAMAAGSTDAVNGDQLHATDQVARQAAALSANSVQYDPGRESVTLVGNAAAPVVLRNVAAGTSPTDAANLGQLQAGMQSVLADARAYTDARTSSALAVLDFDLRQLRRDMGAGTSAALSAAALPQASEPGRTMVAIGGGTYRGQSALALGASTFLQDGHSILRLGATYDSRGYGGANAGFGYQF